MTSTVAYCILACLATVDVVLAICAPDFLSDKNKFLSDFMNYNLLSILGVFVAITLASASQLHLSLNAIEEKVKRRNVFLKTRENVSKTVYCLLWLFIFALIIVIIKPVTPQLSWLQTLLNGSGIIIAVWNVMLLLDLVETVFGIKPMIDD